MRRKYNTKIPIINRFTLFEELKLNKKAANNMKIAATTIAPEVVNKGIMKIAAKHPTPEPAKLKKYIFPVFAGKLLIRKQMHKPDIKNGIASTR